jgi:hypothetical protein
MAVQTHVTDSADPVYATWASHAAELPFVWHYEFYVASNGSDVRTKFSPAEGILSKQMADLWGSFARGAGGQGAGSAEGGGVPTTAHGELSWPEYPSLLYLSLPPDGPAVKRVGDFKRADCAFWEAMEPW